MKEHIMKSKEWIKHNLNEKQMEKLRKNVIEGEELDRPLSQINKKDRTYLRSVSSKKYRLEQLNEGEGQ